MGVHMLKKEGAVFQTREEAEEADILLLNTCSIREKAQEKVFHQLGRWKKLKDNNPDLQIGIEKFNSNKKGYSMAEVLYLAFHILPQICTATA